MRVSYPHYCMQFSNMPAVGSFHTVLLKSDGAAAAFGTNDSGQCNIPALPDGVIYTQAAAGRFHTVLLKSDGTAAAVGGNDSGQCNIPALPEGVTYTQAAAGGVHTVLLKSDGTAAAFGSNIYGQCNIPVLPASEGISYRRSGDQRLRTILTIEFGSRHAAFYMCSGEEVLRVKLNALDTLNDLRRRYVNGITGTSREFCAVLPTGEILEDLCAQTLTASLEPWLLRKRARLVE